ncbi:unnamed protein product [Mytilus coruscus]|uniref:Uncharacterized protein n=1 Tax=Mytilus coruscus TaxID=42192 RepID=A0A6J8DEW4_MYTCO|nr:unnamed protein product [Mytilus coruscus]
MVELGADVKSKGSNGNTVLHVVIDEEKFSKDNVSFFLINRADINAINNFEETPLVSCMKRGSNYATVENISFLLENGANPNICANGSNSALLEAISFESYDVATVLIDHKANLNHVGKNGNTVLHVVFSKEQRRMVQHYSYFDDYDFYDYIESDDDMYDMYSDSSSNAFIGESERDNDKDCTLQINDTRTTITEIPMTEDTDQETNPDIKDDNDTKPEKTENKLLSEEICKRDAASIKTANDEIRKGKDMCEVLEIAVQLMNAGACLNIVNKDGHTPLNCLIKKQDTTTIEAVLPYLLEKGSDPNLGKDLPLIAAAFLDQTMTTKMLLEHGADVDRKNSKGHTALTTTLEVYCHSTKAGLRYRKGIVDIQLSAGASATFQDGNEKNPLILLINSVKQSENYYYTGYDMEVHVSETVSKLIGNGADPNSTPTGEDSALIVAVEYTLLPVVKILLESCADINHLEKNGQNVVHSCFRSEENDERQYNR